ncbi:hypothetical protein A9Q81_13200, partial [Gammaproteobacteria bacterium 42_54_T18]
SAIQTGEFRDDLYYRIKGLTLSTSALSERSEDIPLLLHFFLKNYNHSNQLKLTLEKDVINWFCQSPWPGNVRELKNTLESAAAICLGGKISVQEIALIRSDMPKNKVAQEDQGGIVNNSLEHQVTQLEKKLITQAMLSNDNNKTHSAQALGITRQGLINKINRYELEF